MTSSTKEEPVQTWDPERYERHAGFVADLGRDLIDLLDPAPGHRVLDVGCGDGRLSLELAARGVRVVGIDGSPEQVEAARARGLDARVADAQELAFHEEFDGVFSNAAYHWMPRVDEAIDSAYRALVPGGAFVAELGGHGCASTITSAFRTALERRGLDGASPWYFPTAEGHRTRLEARGFVVERAYTFDRPTPLPGDVLGWIETFCESFVTRAPEAERRELLEEVRTAAEPVLRRPDGSWWVDYVRMRFRAVRPR